MATTWRFAEYNAATGEPMHVAEFSWPEDAPETRGQFEARVKANGNAVVFLTPDDPLPDALKHIYDAKTETFVDRPQPAPAGGPRP